MYCLRFGDRHGESIIWIGNIQQKRKVQNFGFAGRPHPLFPPLVVYPQFLIRKHLRRVLSLLTAIMNDSNFFQSNKFIVCKVKDKKEVANSLMALNQLKIIHLFQDKTHLRT